jgi:hypothetical protein
MQQDAIDISTQALEKFNIEKDIAAFIKKEFDKKYNPTWHCIVGKSSNSHFEKEGTSGHTSLTRQSTSSTSILVKLLSFFSNLAEQIHWID